MITTSTRHDRLRAFGDIGRLREVLERPVGVDDLGSLPLTTKHDLRADQEAFPPFGKRLRCPLGDVNLLVESSGSSGGPKEVHLLSIRDEATVISMIADSLAEAGVVSGDVVALTLPIGPAGGGLKMMLALRQVGATVLRIGALSTQDKVRQIQTYGATVIVGTPAYTDSLRSQWSARAASTTRPVRLLLVATQSMSMSWLTRCQTAWDATVHEWYGNAAGVFAMTGRCGALTASGHRGTLHWDPEHLFIEVRDGERLVNSGERGQLVATHLQNSTAPLTRFATGDEGRFVAPGDCPCGSERPGIESGTVRRLDAMMKIRGVNVWPSLVDRVAADADVERYWLQVSTDATAREVVTMYVQSASASRIDHAALASALRHTVGLRFQIVEWNDPEPPEFVRISAAGKQIQWTDSRATR